jgi:hypothetical protein
MSKISVSASGYDIRSLQHENRMLAIYRVQAASDAASIQPLANACWRAASFEWVISRDRTAVRALWAEGARALAQGFARKAAGFDPSPDQFILGINLSIAAREREAFTTLARFAPGIRATSLQNARAFRGARGHAYLAEAYGLISAAILERRRDPAVAAIQSLGAAIEQNDIVWWQQRFPDPSEAAWRFAEHNAICELLQAIVRRLSAQSASPRNGLDPSQTESNDTAANRFTAAMDQALDRLVWFVDGDPNHHPKLYLWLPGIALCVLAAAAGISLNLLPVADRTQNGYSRLPVELILDQHSAG